MAGKISSLLVKRSLNDKKNMKGRHAKNKSSAQKSSKITRNHTEVKVDEV